ncbi:hypothetical protein BaRGS_00003691 [Batillaria attramentaria]|uniref:Uncharacterized protein n=1 Tax=Batillaria attramentaria TaxID=370345 RepID=A0ABD0M097_9CAEN
MQNTAKFSVNKSHLKNASTDMGAYKSNWCPLQNAQCLLAGTCLKRRNNLSRCACINILLFYYVISFSSACVVADLGTRLTPREEGEAQMASLHDHHRHHSPGWPMPLPVPRGPMARHTMGTPSRAAPNPFR